VKNDSGIVKGLEELLGFTLAKAVIFAPCNKLRVRNVMTRILGKALANALEIGSVNEASNILGIKCVCQRRLRSCKVWVISNEKKVTRSGEPTSGLTGTL